MGLNNSFNQFLLVIMLRDQEYEISCLNQVFE